MILIILEIVKVNLFANLILKVHKSDLMENQLQLKKLKIKHKQETNLEILLLKKMKCLKILLKILKK